MTVLIGFRPGDVGRDALHLGVLLARSMDLPLALAAVVPEAWPTPSMAKIDAEYVGWNIETAEQTLDEACAEVRRLESSLAVRTHRPSGRSVSAALLNLADRIYASTIVLGSAGEGASGRISVGSAANRLLHSSTVPVALAPRGFQIESGARVGRLTSAYSGAPEADAVVATAARLAARLDARLRVLTFGVRNKPMIPPEVSLSTEDDVLAEWSTQMTAEHARLLGEIDPDLPGGKIETGVAVGSTWAQALDDTGWEPHELLAIGSSSLGPIARVFLGSRATKIVRESPVPVVVLPGGGM